MSESKTLAEALPNIIYDLCLMAVEMYTIGMRVPNRVNIIDSSQSGYKITLKVRREDNKNPIFDIVVNFIEDSGSTRPYFDKQKIWHHQFAEPYLNKNSNWFEQTSVHLNILQTLISFGIQPELPWHTSRGLHTAVFDEKLPITNLNQFEYIVVSLQEDAPISYIKLKDGKVIAIGILRNPSENALFLTEEERRELASEGFALVKCTILETLEKNRIPLADLIDLSVDLYDHTLTAEYITNL